MKKVIAIILSLVMVCCMSVSAFAASEPQYGYHEMTVSGYSYSTFSYNIPETLELQSTNQNSVTLGIDTFNLDDGYVISFQIMNGIDNHYVQLKNVNDETQTTKISFRDTKNNMLDLVNPVATFTIDELKEDIHTRYIYVDWQPEETLKAGTYSGVVVFGISAYPAD